jgi:adenine phosphoribosyltransferase
MKRVREEMTNYLKSTIRTIPDFPKPGIQFRDITTLLKDREALALTADMLVSPFIDLDIDVVVGIESRGFMLVRF